MHAPSPAKITSASFRTFSKTDWTVFLLPILFIIGFYWMRSHHRTYYYHFVKEDGPAENFQALMGLGATVISALVARVFFRGGQRFMGVVFALLTLALFLVSGEEISWGQRLFGWQTSGYFAQDNVQHETNLHNDVHFKPFLDVSVLAVTTFAFLAPLLHMQFVRRRAYLLSFFATELPTTSFFFVCGAIYAVYIYLNPVIRPHYHGFDLFFWQDLEMAETFFYPGVFFTLWFKWRTAKQLYGEAVASPSTSLGQNPALS